MAGFEAPNDSFCDKAGKKGHRGWLGIFAGEDSGLYLLDPSRSHRVPPSHFSDDVQGVLIVDRYSASKAIKQVKSGRLLLAFCWAHVRRDFVKVGKGYPELVPWAFAWLRRIAELYRLNRERLKHATGTDSFVRADTALRHHVAAMAEGWHAERSDTKLRLPCRKVLASLSEPREGVPLFVDDPRIPMDNNYSERLIRSPVVGRKNYYGSGSEWSGRLAVTMFSRLATLGHWKINLQQWLKWYFDACAANGGKPPSDPDGFLPWNLASDRLAELRSPPAGREIPDTS